MAVVENSRSTILSQGKKMVQREDHDMVQYYANYNFLHR